MPGHAEFPDGPHNRWTHSEGAIPHARDGVHVLWAMDGVSEFTRIQHDKPNPEVQIVASRRWREERIQAIESGLRNRLGQDVHKQARLLDTIPPEASGKHRCVVSHARLDGGLENAASHPQPENP
jgi:phenylacetate-CoA ligase